MGGQADKVAAVLKERYAPAMSLTEAMNLAIAALAGQGDGTNAEPITGDQLEAALLERSRPHRAFRRLTGARLDALLAEARAAAAGDGRREHGATTEGADDQAPRRRTPRARPRAWRTAPAGRWQSADSAGWRRRRRAAAMRPALGGCQVRRHDGGPGVDSLEAGNVQSPHPGRRTS